MALISPPSNTKFYSLAPPQPIPTHRPGRTTIRRCINIYPNSPQSRSERKGNLVHNSACSSNKTRGNHRRRPLLPAATATPMPAAEGGRESDFGRIPLSDVALKRRRNVCWGRKWSSRDVGTAVVVVAMHLLCSFAPFTLNWGAFLISVGLYVATGLLGITLSFHRNLSHGSFKLPKWLEYLFAYCGAQALQGVRIVWVYHITWLVNSACHVWGKQAWNTGDLSRNNWWVALLAFGEGWHYNHHAFEFSARHGLEWWQIDMTWYAVKFLQVVGLATEVKLPTDAHKQRMMGFHNNRNGSIST